jgi:predicted neutral ceramidase superfamily lipid hydrolase
VKAKALQIRNAIFWAMIVIFVLLVAVVLSFGRLVGLKLPPSTMIYLAVAFFILAAALVVLTAKLKESGVRKFFFILTGASAIGIPICAVLHNLVYALCIKFGWVFWGEGGDEAVFFILAIFVFPALFVIGSLGSIVLLISARLRKKES